MYSWDPRLWRIIGIQLWDGWVFGHMGLSIHDVPPKLTVSLLTMIIFGWLTGTTIYGNAFETQLSFAQVQTKSFCRKKSSSYPLSVTPSEQSQNHQLLMSYDLCQTCWSTSILIILSSKASKIHTTLYNHQPTWIISSHSLYTNMIKQLYSSSSDPNPRDLNLILVGR